MAQLDESVILDQFNLIQDLTTKAMLGTNDQTILKRKIFSLTVRLIHKLKSKGKLEKKGLKVKVG